MADYDTYSGLDFENAELANELEPKKITEEAIMQLIRHIKMEYQPDGTVDAASDGPVKGKAVWDALHKLIAQRTIIPTAEMTKSHQELYDSGTDIDVTQYVYDITEVDPTTGIVIKRAALDVQFVSQPFTVNRWGIPEFQGKTFTLYLSGEEDTSGSMPPSTDLNGSTCELVWKRAWGGFGDESWDRHSIKTFTRQAGLFYDDGKYTLHIRPTSTAIYAKIADDVVMHKFNEIEEGAVAGMTRADVIDNWTPRMKIRKVILSKGMI